MFDFGGLLSRFKDLLRGLMSIGAGLDGMEVLQHHNLSTK
jgi:hypothetical protein